MLGPVTAIVVGQVHIINLEPLDEASSLFIDDRGVTLGPRPVPVLGLARHQVDSTRGHPDDLVDR